MATKVAIEVDVKVGDAGENLSNVKNELKGVETQAKKSTDQMKTGFGAASKQATTLPGPIGMAASSMNMLRASTLKFVTALKSVKVAVAATGIGLLLIAITSLFQYFNKTERGAQALRIASAALGAVMDTLLDVVIKVGETIFRAFTEPKKVLKEFANSFKTYVIDQFTNMFDGVILLGSAIQKVFSGDIDGALKDAGDGAKKLAEGFFKLNPITGTMIAITEGAIELGKEIANDASEAAKLAGAMNKVKVAERELGVERAKTLKIIAEARLAAEDETKSAEERLEKIKEAAELEGNLTAKELANEEEKLRIMKAQAELSETGEETLQAIADQEAKVSQVQLTSLNLNRRLKTELNSLEREIETEREKRATDEQKRLEEANKQELKILEQLKETRIALIQDEQAQKEEKVKLDLEKKLARIEGDSANEIELRKNLQAIADQEISEIQKEFKDKELAALEEAAKKKKDINDKEVADTKAAELAKTKLRQDGLSAAGSVLGALDQLITASGSNSKQALVLQKTLAVAQIAIDTAKAIVGAIAQAQSVPYPGNLVAIATGVAAVIAGIASAVTTLNSADVGGASAAQPQAPQVTSAPAVQQATAGTTELGGAEQAQLAPIQAFVVETEVTGNQNNVNQIESQANFG
tara:strand:- start:120 stop:2048 length:1929 start_codon:yes stop_codon:yes gene_type:complete